MRSIIRSVSLTLAAATLAVAAQGCFMLGAHDGAIVAVPKAPAADERLANDVTPAMLEAHRPDLGQDPYVISRVLLKEKQWRPERNNLGIQVGRTRKMDALARSGDRCWVLHFVVLEDQGSYEANRDTVTIDGDQSDRHRVDCKEL